MVARQNLVDGSVQLCREPPCPSFLRPAHVSESRVSYTPANLSRTGMPTLTSASNLPLS